MINVNRFLLLVMALVTLASPMALAAETSDLVVPRNECVEGRDFTDPFAPSASALSSILLMYGECSGALSFFDTALTNLGLPFTEYNDFARFDSALTSGVEWSLVIVDSYGATPDTATLTHLNEYLAAGGFVIFSNYWARAYADHPIMTTFGVTIDSSYTTPQSFQANFGSHPIFNTPNSVSSFPWTQDQCNTDGSWATTNPGAAALATLTSFPSNGAIVLGAANNSLFLCYTPKNHLGDFNDNTRTDMEELCENQIMFALQDQVVAVYEGAVPDTVDAAGVTVAVRYAGATGPTSGDFIYRQGGANSYSPPQAMYAVLGDTTHLYYDVPPGLLTARGLEFFIRVRRGGTQATAAGPSSPITYIVDFTGGTQAPRTDPMPNGVYRIISVPVDIVGNTTVDSVILDDLGPPEGGIQWRLFQYDRGTDTTVEYPTVSNVTPAQGYWLAVRGNKRYGANGYSRQPNNNDNNIWRIGATTGDWYYALDLDSGWNMVANPLPFAIDWDSVNIDTNGVVVTGADRNNVLRDTIYQWLGGTYQTTQRVGGWLGFYVEVTRPAGVRAWFRYQQSTAPGVRSKPALPEPASNDHWTLKLRLDGDQSFDDGNFIGVRADASRGPDRYDFSEPPPAPTGVQMGFRLPEGTDTRLQRTDYRPPLTEGESWQLEFTPATNRRLSITGFDQVPAGLEAVLILDDGHTFELREGSVISLPDDAATGRLVIGTSDFAAQEKESVRPDSYALHQNFPNPFNPRTSIRFSLPEATDVRLTVYNVLGRQVRVLASGHHEAGTHDLVWDGTDAGGQSVATGVYFYRLEAGDFSAERKLLFLK